MNRSLLFRSSCLAATALSLSLLAGCDPEPTPNNPNNGTGPLYALTTQIFGQEPTSYIVLTNKVDQTATLSLDNALSLPGRALGVGIAKTGSIYVGLDDGSTITRYTLSENGTLQQNGQVDFLNQGVSSIGEYQGNFQFISPTKAYYFDGASSQAIVWNPTDMSVIKAIKLEGLTVEGTSLVFSPSPSRRENQLIMPVAWRTKTGIVIKQAGVVSIDTRTDTATIVTDKRCGYVHSSVFGADGQVYLATEAYGSAAHRLGPDNNPEPCLLKFNPDTLQFDPTFYKQLNSLAGGAVTGALLPGPQGTTYVRVLDESLAPESSFSNARLLASGAGWGWWKVDTTTWTATKQDGFPATTGSTFLYEADNQILYSEFAAGSTATTLHLLGDNGKPTVTTQGLTFSFLQLR
jgi:hypothetical protein